MRAVPRARVTARMASRKVQPSQTTSQSNTTEQLRLTPLQQFTRTRRPRCLQAASAARAGGHASSVMWKFRSPQATTETSSTPRVSSNISARSSAWRSGHRESTAPIPRASSFPGARTSPRSPTKSHESTQAGCGGAEEFLLQQLNPESSRRPCAQILKRGARHKAAWSCLDAEGGMHSGHTQPSSAKQPSENCVRATNLIPVVHQPQILHREAQHAGHQLRSSCGSWPLHCWHRRAPASARALPLRA